MRTIEPHDRHATYESKRTRLVVGFNVDSALEKALLDLARSIEGGFSLWVKSQLALRIASEPVQGNQVEGQGQDTLPDTYPPSYVTAYVLEKAYEDNANFGVVREGRIKRELLTASFNTTKEEEAAMVKYAKTIEAGYGVWVKETLTYMLYANAK